MPLVADAVANAHEMFEDEIDKTDNGVVKSDYYKGSDRKIGNDLRFNTRKELAARENAEDEKNYHWIEQADVYQESTFMQMPVK